MYHTGRVFVHRRVTDISVVTQEHPGGGLSRAVGAEPIVGTCAHGMYWPCPLTPPAAASKSRATIMAWHREPDERKRGLFSFRTGCPHVADSVNSLASVRRRCDGKLHTWIVERACSSADPLGFEQAQRGMDAATRSCTRKSDVRRRRMNVNAGPGLAELTCLSRDETPARRSAIPCVFLFLSAGIAGA